MPNRIKQPHTFTFIGDVHSAADDLQVILNSLDVPNNTFVFIGDYIAGVDTRRLIDGSALHMQNDPLKVLDLIMDRVNGYQDIALLGNHDDFWLQTASGDELAFKTWMINGGKKTINEHLKLHTNSFKLVSAALNEMPLRKYTSFFKKLPLTWQNEAILAMHAGIDWHVNPLSLQTRDTLLWIRDEYLFNNAQNPTNYHRNDLGKVIVTGHTPIQTIDLTRNYLKMQADVHDAPCYLIDTGSRSGASSGGISALTLDDHGEMVTYHLAQNGYLHQLS